MKRTTVFTFIVFFVSIIMFSRKEAFCQTEKSLIGTYHVRNVIMPVGLPDEDKEAFRLLAPSFRKAIITLNADHHFHINGNFPEPFDEMVIIKNGTWKYLPSQRSILISPETADSTGTETETRTMEITISTLGSGQMVFTLTGIPVSLAVKKEVSVHQRTVKTAKK